MSSIKEWSIFALIHPKYLRIYTETFAKTVGFGDEDFYLIKHFLVRPYRLVIETVILTILVILFSNTDLLMGVVDRLEQLKLTQSKDDFEKLMGFIMEVFEIAFYQAPHLQTLAMVWLFAVFGISISVILELSILGALNLYGRLQATNATPTFLRTRMVISNTFIYGYFLPLISGALYFWYQSFVFFWPIFTYPISLIEW